MSVWPFIPQREFSESLEWLTEVLSSKSSEQRISLRDVPRHNLSFEYLLDNGQYSRARALATASSLEQHQVPLWQYVERLGVLPPGQAALPVDAAHAEYLAGGQAVVWGDDDAFEVVDVLSTTSSSINLAAPTVGDYANAYVCPLRNFWMSQALEGARGASDLAKVRAYFQSTSTYALPAASPAYPVYRTFDVMDDRNVLLGDVTDKLVRDVEWVDSSFGAMEPDATLSYMTSGTQMSWDTLDRAAQWRLRCWLYARRGRQVGFWLPTWNRDLRVAADILSADTALTVADYGYRNAYLTRDVMLTSTSGAVHYLRVVGGEAAAPGLETLHLSAATGFALPAAQVESVCFLDFARLDADRVEFHHRAARGASVSVPIALVPSP